MSEQEEAEDMTFKHWATVISEKAIELFGQKQTVCTGWSPSGYYHLGNFREGVTCRAIARELDNLGTNPRFIINIDDQDPFDRIPSFFKKFEKELEPYLGYPINEVPDPLGCHDSYAGHFIDDALNIMHNFDVNPEPTIISEYYKKGDYDKYAKLFIEKKEEVYEITERITGSRMEDFFMIQCPKCKNIDAPKTLSAEIENSKIRMEILCQKEKNGCGFQGKIMLGDTTWKLKWRLDWAARQDFFGVSVESSGKDHGAAGGSIDTSLAFHEKIFGKTKLPLLIQHGFLTVGGKKASGSVGSGVPVSEFHKMLDPEIFLYLIYRHNLRTDFDFDVKNDLPKIASEFSKAREVYIYGEGVDHQKSKEKTWKAFELALIDKDSVSNQLPIEIGHLATLMQVFMFDRDKTFQKMVERSSIEDSKQLEVTFEQNFTRTKYWLDNYANDNFKFSISEKTDCDMVNQLEQGIYENLLAAIKELPDNLHGDDITQYLYKIAKEKEIKTANFFRALYVSVLSKKFGPRAGTLIDALSKEKTIKFLEKALECY
ncbi:MAG: lysine--tRNA ligase [Asgard group archaeon]|nr:lysine--tRNA ligase [Asgard group archaeon]